MPFVELGDLQLFYEQHGAGTPLVLLNGALGTIAADWAPFLPALSERYAVLAYEQRGHGRSSLPPNSFRSYDQLAADLAALLDALGVGAAHFCGFSDGAITLKAFALAYPERVRSLVLVGAQYTNDERTLATWAKMTPERIAERVPAWAAQLETLHDTHHYKGYWRELLQTMRPLWREQPNFALDELARITQPTLLIAGERDTFGHLDQQLAMYRALPNAELCIAPNAGHAVLNDAPELFRLVALDFLARQLHA